MSNRYLIHIPTGEQLYPKPGQERLFENLAKSDAYQWSDQPVEVTVPQAKDILENERVALVKEREQLEKDKEAFFRDVVAFENEKAEWAALKKESPIEVTLNAEPAIKDIADKTAWKELENKIEQPAPKTRAKRKTK
jgi:hypothetical protein